MFTQQEANEVSRRLSEMVGRAVPVCRDDWCETEDGDACLNIDGHHIGLAHMPVGYCGFDTQVFEVTWPRENEACFGKLDNALSKLADVLNELDMAECEHGVRDGDWCEPCNAAHKAAAIDADNGNAV